MKKIILLLLLGACTPLYDQTTTNQKLHGKECILVTTILTQNGIKENNTLPRAWQQNKYSTMEDCVDAEQHRHNFNKWEKFTDEQGHKVSKSECACFL